MGSRANYVIVDGEGWRLFYSHWGAQSVDVELAAGPEHAARFIGSQQACDPESGWLDDVWCEGGAAVDLTRGYLTFFGGFEVLHGLNFRRAYFAVLEQMWPGWTVDWAYDGLADLAACVGVDAATVRVPGTDPATVDPAPTLVPADDEDIDTGYWALLTVRDGDAELTTWQISSLCVDAPLVWLGPGMVDLLPIDALTRSAVLTGQPPRWGIHVDRPARQVRWWATADYAGLQAKTVGQWPGWDVGFWQDRYEDHRAACGDVLRVPDIDYAAGFDELTDRLMARFPDPVARAAELVDILRDAGHTVEVTGPVTAHVQVDPDDQQRQRVLAAIAAARQAVTGRG